MTNLRIWRMRIGRPGWPSTWAAVAVFTFLIIGMGVLSAYRPRIGLLLALGVPLAAGLIVWPEIALVLYANAGLFKADPRLSLVSSLFDMTLALGAILVALSAHRILLRRERTNWSREMSLTLIFAGVIVSGLLYTPAYQYGTDKALRFISLTMLAFFTPIVIIKSYRSLWSFLVGWLAFAMLLTVEALGQLGTGQRLSAFNATAIAISRTLGVAIIMLLFAVLMGRVSRPWYTLAIAGLILMMLALIGSGSRGPLLTLLGTVVLTVMLSVAKPGRRMRSLVIMGILGIVVAGVFLSGLIPAVSFQRFDLFFNQPDTDTSAQARLRVMDEAWQLFTTSPMIGHGTGSVSAFGAGEELIYPHNILLELAAETGIVGLSLCLGVIGMVLWRLLSNIGDVSRDAALSLTLLAILVFTLLNALVSGDLNDNRNLWLFAGVAIATTQIRKEMTA